MLCDGSAFTRDTQRGFEPSLSLGVEACGPGVWEPAIRSLRPDIWYDTTGTDMTSWLDVSGNENHAAANGYPFALLLNAHNKIQARKTPGNGRYDLPTHLPPSLVRDITVCVVSSRLQNQVSLPLWQRLFSGRYTGADYLGTNVAIVSPGTNGSGNALAYPVTVLIDSRVGVTTGYSRIGANIDGSSAFIGQIFEIIIFHRILIRSEARSLRQALNLKYNLTPVNYGP